MLDLRLIIDLVTVLMAAALGGLLSARLKLPVLLGYILGGMVVGPKGLGLIKEIVQVETLAQLGAAFLLFGLGVEFSLAELRKVQTIALGGGTLQILITVGITTVVSLLIGWVATPVQGIFLGCILSLSSTAVVLRSLAERNEMETVHGQVSLGILIVQDIALGLMLAVLPALDSPQAVGQAVLRALLVTALFAGAAIAFGRWCIPSLLRWVASTESKELFLLCVVVLCLGIALVTESLGLSIEMGAFVAGLMISEVELPLIQGTLNYTEQIVHCIQYETCIISSLVRKNSDIIKSSFFSILESTAMVAKKRRKKPSALDNLSKALRDTAFLSSDGQDAIVACLSSNVWLRHASEQESSA